MKRYGRINFLISLIEIFVMCSADLRAHAVQSGGRGWKNCLWSHQKFLLSDTNLHEGECSAITGVAKWLKASCLSARNFSSFSLALKFNFLRRKRQHEAGADKSSRENVRRRPNRKLETFIFHYYAAASRWIGRSKPVESSRRNSRSFPSQKSTSSIARNIWARRLTKLLLLKVSKLPKGLCSTVTGWMKFSDFSLWASKCAWVLKDWCSFHESSWSVWD